MMGWNCARGATLPCPNGARGAAGCGGDAVCPGGAKALLCGAPGFGGFTGKSALRGGLPFRKGWQARREAGKNRFAYSRASFKGWQTRPEHGGRGRFARGENCPLFPRPPRFRNHPAGRPAGSARTRPRDQSLGYPFLGNRPTSPPSPRPPKRRRRQVPARGLAAVCTLTAPPETQRSIHAPCSWGMDASPPSRRRWPPALPALVEFGALEHVATEEERQ